LQHERRPSAGLVCPGKQELDDSRGNGHQCRAERAALDAADVQRILVRRVRSQEQLAQDLERARVPQIGDETHRARQAFLAGERVAFQQAPARAVRAAPGFRVRLREHTDGLCESRALAKALPSNARTFSCACRQAVRRAEVVRMA
jgi:hypothetical protein